MAQHFQRRKAIVSPNEHLKMKNLLDIHSDIVQALDQQLRRPVSLNKLVNESKFTKSEVKAIYRAFKEASPNALVKRDIIREAFVELFPKGDTEHYADMVFNTFDLDHTGMITFEEFIKSMSTLCRGTLKEKIDWIYKMYDPRNTGVISWERLFFVITAMDDLIGYDARPIKTREQKINHTNEIFNKFDPNNTGLITKEQFTKLCLNDPNILNSISHLYTILPTA
ncbi:EF-hand domain and EF-hand domain pair-containing protein [Strongyloides ratti]|uniref:EF-hand domain and EF-hand domain pair-containing protein n=1 Tax=Strongyloides ratti TaxID=34506 RepID=A0A090MNX3_STRRB|nr:EF-hand domain and EF-hand domain pair-containing protein [Strongyloides ratti]CEF59766.1 EF-hand domain and EF-hand domain pair-containing protein [Strongyloides ratti]